MAARRSVDELLADARAELQRVDPAEAERLVAGGGWLVDIRPVGLRRRDGEIPGARVVDRNQLEWRLDPQSAHRLDDVGDDLYERPVILVCDEGYASSFAARDLRRLGLEQATDLVGGYQAWRAAGRTVRSSQD